MSHLPASDLRQAATVASCMYMSCCLHIWKKIPEEGMIYLVRILVRRLGQEVRSQSLCTLYAAQSIRRVSNFLRTRSGSNITA